MQSSDIRRMKTYYDPKDLKRFGKIADWDGPLAEKFFAWYGEVFEEGALTACLGLCKAKPATATALR